MCGSSTQCPPARVSSTSVLAIPRVNDAEALERQVALYAVNQVRLTGDLRCKATGCDDPKLEVHRVTDAPMRPSTKPT